MIGMALAKSLYAIPTWTRTVALVEEHPVLAEVIAPDGQVPSIYACYRFMGKLRGYECLLEDCIAEVVGRLKARRPELGEDVAIDASDMPAYANGQRFTYHRGPERERYSDPDASWGHRSSVSTRKGGGFYGYRLHMAVCSATDLPLAWRVESGRVNETKTVEPLLDALGGRGVVPETCAMDRGYDNATAYEACAARGIDPVVPLRKTVAVRRGDHRPPQCEHGRWCFAGADRKRGATKWRCPTGECKPASVWVKANRLHPLIPRETRRWKDLYRSRGAVERAFGRLKTEWGLTPLRVRRIEKVRTHVGLTVLSQLSSALVRAETDPMLP
jgi:hypothetical protein